MHELTTTNVKHELSSYFCGMSERLQKAVGDAVKAARLAKGLTQKELGELAGMKQPNIVSLEKGKANLSLSQLERVAEVLGLTVDVILR